MRAVLDVGQYASDEEIHQFEDLIALAATLTPSELEVAAVEDDPTDNKILACAQEGQVDYVVASDAHLADLRHFKGIPIVSPRRFLEILDAQRGEDTH